MDADPSARTLEALLRLAPLDRLPRTGWILAGVPDPESVAAHCHGASLVALALAPSVDPPLDVDRAVCLAAVHDLPEALTGDIPKPGSRHLPPGAKSAAEAAAAEELLGPLPPAALERWLEYERGETREARFAKLCDRLHLGVRLVGYHRAGVRGLEEFARTVGGTDCGEFPVCDGLRRAVLSALGTPAGGLTASLPPPPDAAP